MGSEGGDQHTRMAAGGVIQVKVTKVFQAQSLKAWKLGSWKAAPRRERFNPAPGLRYM